LRPDFAIVQEFALILMAPVIGSFLGVVIRRLPEQRAMVWSRSHCEGCGTPLAAADLVPLVSWALLRGRCRRCGQPLGWFYPATELAALVVALIALALDDFPRVWLDCVFGWWLLALAWTDIRTWLLPDLLTLPLIVAGLAETAIFEPADLLDRILGAVAGYVLLRGIALAYRAVRGTHGLGGGDAKLLAAAGAWLGVSALPHVILAAALSALAAVAVLQVARYKMKAQSALMFGPFIAAPTWIIWLLRG
jgi:leader peptidase (prepilin peptidase)/N-methyltransferase